MVEKGMNRKPSMYAAVATRDLLAAKSIDELVEWSNGLYKPPENSLIDKAERNGNTMLFLGLNTLL